MTEAITRQVQDLRWAELQDELAGLRSIITPRCPRCESMAGQWRGYRRNKKEIIHRRWCTECGKWFTGATHIRKTPIPDTASDDALLPDKLRYDAWKEAYEEAQESSAAK